MADLEKKIAEILQENGIEWCDHKKLAGDIQSLVRNTTLQGLKESYLNTDRIKKPLPCPICEKNIQIHSESLNRTNCELLIKACKITALEGKKYFHAGEDLGVSYAIGGGWAKLKHWGLIEQQPNPKDSTKAIKGMWSVTEKAMLFIGRQIKLPAKVYLYNSELKSSDRKEIDIVDAIGDFDAYKQLMNQR